MRINLQPAFILHQRAYRETSVLLDVLTIEYGRISLIARGVRSRRSLLRALLQPFIPLFVSFQGKTELMQLISAEPNGAAFRLQGHCLLSGFYLNELVCRLLQKGDPHPRLFDVYRCTLMALQGDMLNQSVLRLFEKKLLDELGYGVSLNIDFVTGNAILLDKYYQYYPEQGFTQSEQHTGAFLGKHLIAFEQEELFNNDVLRAAKRLMRIVLGSILGELPLHSRKLFTEVTQ